ncbi:hypothetical protein DENSPDRAFT_852924 [Dentipellis sp. KUC8613]|nr:hypothetical protein DENSPDRAFT_852924 [Dentipellis sp. KUC8613]
MSYHPYATARDHRASSSTNRTSTSEGYTTFNVTANSSLNATTSNAAHVPGNYTHALGVPNPQAPKSANSDDQILYTDAEIDQEIYEAKIARSQGLISTVQYLDILCAGLNKGSTILDRKYEGIQRAMRGEDSRESIQRDAGFTDAEMDAELDQAERIIRIQLVNERREGARRFRRAVTRGAMKEAYGQTIMAFWYLCITKKNRFSYLSAARDHRASPSAYQNSTSAAYSEFNITTRSSLTDAAASNAVLAPANYALDLQGSDSHISNTVNSGEQVLPTAEQTNQQMYETKIAHIQGRMSTAEYGRILVAGLEQGSARLERDY